MSVGISSSQIDSMLSMLRTTAAQAAAPSTKPLGQVTSAINSDGISSSNSGTATVSFADALKSSLSQVNQVQVNAQQLGSQFISGDDKVSISDVMIAGQKASISLQTTVQVRNKVVAAYNDIMNMQI